MTIIDALLDGENNVRLTCENKWLVCNESCGKITYLVYQHKYGAKHTKILVETDDENKALLVLLGKQ